MGLTLEFQSRGTPHSRRKRLVLPDHANHNSDHDDTIDELRCVCFSGRLKANVVSLMIQPAKAGSSIFENDDCQISVLEMGLAPNDDGITFGDVIIMQIHPLNTKTAEIRGIEETAEVDLVIRIAWWKDLTDPQ